MKTKNLIFTLAAIMAGVKTYGAQPAAQTQAKRSLSLQEKIEITNAIDIVVDERVLDTDSRDCLQFDGNLNFQQNLPAPANAMEIAKAISILVDENVLVADSKECMQFDGDVISQLKQLGLLKNANSHLLTVCIQGGAAHLSTPPALLNGGDEQGNSNGNN